MRAYKLEILIIDHDGLDENEVVNVLENANYPNDCISPKVMSIETREIGEWSDEHPLNQRSTFEAAYEKLFGGPYGEA